MPVFSRFVFLNPPDFKLKNPFSIPFETYIDDRQGIRCSVGFDPAVNNFLLTLVNGFEDGKWRSTTFHEFVWDNISETALSFSERAALTNKSHSSLRAAAKNLRLVDKVGDVGGGSEIAEIILYAIMKHHFHALPVIPKIFYKQNPQDYAKGADSVHITLEATGDFSLWFGEAKFFNGIGNSRFDEIITSLCSALETGKIRKENSLITNLRDLGECIEDRVILARIRKMLGPETSMDLIKPKLNVPILLLHECGETKKTKSLTQDYLDWIHDSHSQKAVEFFRRKFIRMGNIFLFEEVKFHLILLPVNDKREVVKTFLETVEFFKK